MNATVVGGKDRICVNSGANSEQSPWRHGIAEHYSYGDANGTVTQPEAHVPPEHGRQPILGMLLGAEAQGHAKNSGKSILTPEQGDQLRNGNP